MMDMVMMMAMVMVIVMTMVVVMGWYKTKVSRIGGAVDW